MIVAIRENPQRAEMLGYDVRKYQLLTFVIGSGLAGLSGALYTSWGQFITPSSIGLPAAAMPIVWVAFSGRSDLTATLVGSFLLLFGFQTITIYSQQAALVLMGALLLATVMLVPQGFVFGIGKLVAADWKRAHVRRDAGATSADATACKRTRPDHGAGRCQGRVEALRRADGGLRRQPDASKPAKSTA